MTEGVRFDHEAEVMTDPRKNYERVIAQTESVVAAVQPGQLGLPTPCTEFDVRALLGHMVGGVIRAAVIGEGGDALARPARADDVPDDGWVEAYRAAAKRALAAWADPARLTAEFTVPWGTVPGRVALTGYGQEQLMHGWDLARATGQPTELDPDLASWVLEFAQRALSAGSRQGVPFGPVVPVPDDAGVYARLAGWLGRQP
jgi:uncharacterized protein (TIGR03086 family)